MNKKLIAVALLSTIGLAACSHDNNPFNKIDPSDREASNYIFDAGVYAEKKTKNGFKDGDWYKACMQNSGKAKNCEKLYKLMSEYAKAHNKYGNISAKDFSSHAAWKIASFYYAANQDLARTDDEFGF